MNYYNKYSDYLKTKYGEKVYKLPINLPLTCPNRIQASGCSFCAEVGTGFEAMDASCSITEQLSFTKEHISKRYGAHKFIAYFQNFTNTFIPLDQFHQNLTEACQIDDIVEISISTRPDCINQDYLEIMNDIRSTYQVGITIELGLQTANYHTLLSIDRGHGLAEYIDAVLQIQKYNFVVCTHIILNLPNDTMIDVIETAKILSAMKIDIVKVHSLYIANNTKMCSQFNQGDFEICSKEEYLERVATFLDYLSPDIIVERLFSRIPKEDMTFSNWNTSWWKLQDELIELFSTQNRYQGRLYHYLNGAALDKLT
ncbi:MAG: TIGR01212 family radical SAM protein [Eubacteriales bacterium]